MNKKQIIEKLKYNDNLTDEFWFELKEKMNDKKFMDSLKVWIRKQEGKEQ